MVPAEIHTTNSCWKQSITGCGDLAATERTPGPPIAAQSPVATALAVGLPGPSCGIALPVGLEILGFEKYYT